MKKKDLEKLAALAKNFHDAWINYVHHQMNHDGVGDIDISRDMEKKVRDAETDLTLFCANARF